MSLYHPPNPEKLLAALSLLASLDGRPRFKAFVSVRGDDSTGRLCATPEEARERPFKTLPAALSAHSAEWGWGDVIMDAATLRAEPPK